MCSRSETFFDADLKIWSGAKCKPFYSPEMTLGDVFLHTLSMIPEKIVQVFDPTGETLTAGELLEQSKAVAVNLIKMGLQPGDVVCIAANNTPNLTAVAIATFLCGATMHPIYPELNKDAVNSMFRLSTPKIVFCDDDNYERVKQVANELFLDIGIFVMNGNIMGARKASDLVISSDESKTKTSFPCSQLTGSDVAFIICSSGTTGPPKGVSGSHSHLLNTDFYLQFPVNSIVFTFSPLSWATGFMSFVAALKVGVKRIITNKPFSTEYFLYLCETYDISHTFINIRMAAQIVAECDSNARHRLDSLIMAFCGGAKVSNVLVEKFQKILGDKRRPGFTVVYGISEVLGISVYDDGPGEERFGNEGRLYPNVEVRIVGENGENLGIGEKGIVHIRTPYHWTGYYRNPELTKSTYENGWLRSCDIGYFDKHGYLTLCGRDSDVIKFNNSQIFPQFLESVITELTGVMDVCVFAVPDLTYSNLVACAVVCSSNENGILTEEVIQKHVKKRITEEYYPRGGIYFVDSLPRGPAGKINRRDVLDMLNISSKTI